MRDRNAPSIFPRSVLCSAAYFSRRDSSECVGDEAASVFASASMRSSAVCRQSSAFSTCSATSSARTSLRSAPVPAGLAVAERRWLSASCRKSWMERSA